MILPGSRLRIGRGAGTQKRVETAKIGERSDPSGGPADFFFPPSLLCFRLFLHWGAWSQASHDVDMRA